MIQAIYCMSKESPKPEIKGFTGYIAYLGLHEGYIKEYYET